MRAIELTAFSDDLDRLRLVDRPAPTPAHNQVKVKMLMAAVNPSDFNFIHGTYYEALKRMIWNQGDGPVTFDPVSQVECPQPPYILGGEGVGIVVESGGGFLANRLVGKRVAVAAGPPMGTWQDYTVVDAKKALPILPDMTDEQAAMFMVNPLSAYAMVFDVLSVKKGAWLMQSAAGSALGKSVVRMGKAYGFKTINIVRGSENTAALKALGGDVVIETNTQDILHEVNQATGGKGPDFAMDCVGGETASQMVQALGYGAKMILYGTLSGQPLSLPPRDLMMPMNDIQGFLATTWLEGKSLFQKIGAIRQVKKLMRQGVFDTSVDKIFTLDQAVQAIQASKATGRTGKMLIKISD